MTTIDLNNSDRLILFQRPPPPGRHPPLAHAASAGAAVGTGVVPGSAQRRPPGPPATIATTSHQHLRGEHVTANVQQWEKPANGNPHNANTQWIPNRGRNGWNGQQNTME